MLKYQEVYPEYLWGQHNYDESQILQFGERPDLHFEKVIEIFGQWYEVVDEFNAQNMIAVGMTKNPKKKLMKLKTQFRDKVIKAGYSAGNPETIDMFTDLNMAY